MTTPTTFATLKTALDDWTHNGGSLDSKWAEIIAMAEARMYDELILRDMESEEDLTLAVDANYVALPDGFISPIALWLIVDSQRIPLGKRLPEQLPYHTDSTQPALWAIDGENIRFDCPADTAYSAKFRMVKSSALSDTNTTNYLLTRRPDVYMAACLSEYSRYASDKDAFDMWEPKYIKGSASLKAADARSRDVGLRTDLAWMGSRPNIYRGE